MKVLAVYDLDCVVGRRKISVAIEDVSPDGKPVYELWDLIDGEWVAVFFKNRAILTAKKRELLDNCKKEICYEKV